MTGHVVSIAAIELGVYEISLRDESGQTHTYEFTVHEDPVPVTTWTEAFDEQIGTLTGPGVDIAAAVHAFHALCKTDVAMFIGGT